MSINGPKRESDLPVAASLPRGFVYVAILLTICRLDRTGHRLSAPVQRLVILDRIHHRPGHG